MASPSATATLRSIACFEGMKGLAAIVTSLGLLSLVHHDVRHVAYALIGHYGLNPDAVYPRRFLALSKRLADANLRTVILLAWSYAALRIVEGYGLWRARPWAEWLAALSGGLYIPFEIVHASHHPSAINVAILMLNVAVVLYMVGRLRFRIDSP